MGCIVSRPQFGSSSLPAYICNPFYIFEILKYYNFLGYTPEIAHTSCVANLANDKWCTHRFSCSRERPESPSVFLDEWSAVSLDCWAAIGVQSLRHFLWFTEIVFKEIVLAIANEVVHRSRFLMHSTLLVSPITSYYLKLWF